ncbi:MAG: YlbF family regulator [Planctomycetes bacterium]|nr:YlbF family regulator [Planctomycetota bacterium]
MNEILELATKLGKMMAADPRAVAMATARNGLEESRPDRQLLNEYESQQQKLAGLEAEGKPLEPEDKRRLADLHAKVASSDVIKAVIKAQTGYVEMMSAVSRRIEEQAMTPADSA